MSYTPISDYPTDQLPPVPPEPPDVPEEPTSPRRRGRYIALVAVLAVLILAIPIALFVLLRSDTRTPPTGSPSAAGRSPSVAASAPATPSPSAPAAQPAPDGRIPLDQLKNATLDIPAWPTDNLTGPSGKVKFIDGRVTGPPDATFPYQRQLVIFGVTYGDVDRDGAQETLAAIGCIPTFEGSSIQLLALDRTPSGGIVTLGRIVATSGEIRVIDTEHLKVLGDGMVSVQVGDLQRCCGDETPMQWQARTYGWTGREFRQTGGPTAFPVNASVTETGASSGELVLGPAVNGVRHGTVTVTVTFLRGARPDHLVLDFAPPAGLQRDGNAWPTVHPGYDTEFWVDLPTPATGTAVTYTFAFSRPATASGGDLGLHMTGANAKNIGLSESNPYNNASSVTIRTID